MPDVLGMRRRIELRETVIAPGAIVRLKKEYAPRLADLMARWRVLEISERDEVKVVDKEDDRDERTFDIVALERVAGGEIAVVGHTWVDEEDPVVEQSIWGEDQFADDAYDVTTEIEYPSLFDDPIKLQEEEDAEDEDRDDGELA